MKALQTRLARLEANEPADVVLFDRTGNVIFRWHPSRFSECAPLQAYCDLLGRVNAGDPAAVRIVRSTVKASENFGRMHEILKALLEEVPAGSSVN